MSVAKTPDAALERRDNPMVEIAKWLVNPFTNVMQKELYRAVTSPLFATARVLAQANGGQLGAAAKKSQ